MKTPHSSTWAIVILLGLGALQADAQGPQGPPPPPHVTVATVNEVSVPVAYEYVGVTEASRLIEIRARVQGFIESRDFEEGALVKKGQRLFTIDSRSFKADQQIALAQVEQAEARLHLAEQEVKRLRSVKEPGAVAASDIDQKAAEQSNAAALLRLSKAQLAKAELELGYTTVEAPLTGLVGKAEKEIGSLVDSAQNSLLTTLQQVDPIYASFKVTESDYLTMRRQEESGAVVLAADIEAPYLEISLVDGSTYPERGVIDFENVNIDVPTGTVEMRGTFKNPNRVLKPGQFVKVHLKGWERPNAITIPQRAVSQSPQGSFVYVIGAGNKAELRSVKLDQWVGQEWLVLDGLKAGEQIVVQGLTRVQPGIVVVPETAPAPTEPAQTQTASGK